LGIAVRVDIADGEGSLILDVDVLVLPVLLDGLLETLDALHEGRLWVVVVTCGGMWPCE